MLTATTHTESTNHTLGGIRAVALVEAAKGALVLLAGFGVLSLLHKDVREVAEALVGHFHLNPESRIPHVFIELAGRLTDARLWLLAVFAVSYSALRFLEAYGLWNARRWAEWLAVASGAIYLPFEIYELGVSVTALKLVTFALNALVVLYMGNVLWTSRSGGPA
ncbi:DUF2127 domain-containing protein [Methylomagnum sp.]